MGLIKRLGIAVVSALVITGGAFNISTSVSRAAEKIDAYDKADASSKLSSSEFVCSSNKVSMTYSDKGKGVMIKGSKEDVTATKYSFTELFDFGDKTPDYMVVDGLAERKKDTYLEFYADDADKPFAKVKLARQGRADKWDKSQNVCVDFNDNKMKGTHKISFKVVSDDKKEVSLLFRYILFIKSDIPTVDLDIDETQGAIESMNGDPEHNTECYGKMTLKIPEGYKSEYTDETLKTQTYDLDYIRGRGNSTWMPDKKPYKIKLDKKADLLGMGKNKHWVLLANYYDVSMLRNKITYWLGSQLGMEFTPQCEFVNVVMNGKYLGSYYLCEHVRLGESRVDLDDLEESKDATDEATISGGYLLSMNPDADVASGQVINTSRDQNFLIESPEFSDYFNSAQYKYISDYFQKTEDAIYGKNFKDENGVSYSDYLDVDAAIDYYWIQEISMNGDAFGSGSTYLYKKRNGKLYWGPLWDFDYVAWGATEYNGNNVEGYTCNYATWFERLLKDPEFCNKVIERWPAIREKLLEAAQDGGQIDKYSEKQYQSQKANYAILPKYSDTYMDGDIDYEELSNKNDITYDSEEKRLKNWIIERVNWIDQNLDSIKTEYHTVKFMIGKKEYAKVLCNSKDGVELPVEPVKKGYVFKGWFTTIKEGKESYELEITADSRITSDMTAYPKWEKASSSNKLSKIAFQCKDYYIYEEDEVYLNMCTIPFDVKMPELKWSSSDESVAVVKEDGVVCSNRKKGTAVITAAASNGLKAQCKVHVLSWSEMQDANDFTIDKENITLTQGKYSQVVTQSVPAKSYGATFIYKSTDPDVVRVNDCGYIYAENPGTAYICVYFISNSDMKLCKVTVRANEKKNSVFEWKGIGYKFTSVGKKKNVKVVSVTDTTKSKIIIDNKITVSGRKYNITSIDKNAFKDCKKLKSVTIMNKNITKKNINELKKKYKKVKFIIAK